MSSIVFRSTKGSQLTVAEGDQNLDNLNKDKLESITSVSVDGEVALFSGTSARRLKRAAITGICKMVAGVLSAVTATDIVNTLGATPVTNAANAGNAATADNADKLDNFHASSFVRSVNGGAPDVSGNVVVSLPPNIVNTLNGLSGDITVAGALGYTPANHANAGTDHAHTGTYLPIAHGNTVGSLALTGNYETLAAVIGSTYAANSYYLAGMHVGFAITGTWRCCGISYADKGDPGITHVYLWRKVS